MGLLGGNAMATVDCRVPPAAFRGLSAAVDALSSPRQVLEAIFPVGIPPAYNTS